MMYVQTGPADWCDALPSHCTTAGRAEASRHGFSASEAQPGGQAFGSLQDRLGPLTEDAPIDGSVYADEAALPSFAQMAAAQGCLEQAQHSAVCMLPQNRQTSLNSTVTFVLKFALTDLPLMVWAV